MPMMNLHKQNIKKYLLEYMNDKPIFDKIKQNLEQNETIKRKLFINHVEVNNKGEINNQLKNSDIYNIKFLSGGSS